MTLTADLCRVAASAETSGSPTRRVRAADRRALEAMHAVCSAETRRARWRAPLAAMPQRYLDDALSGRPGHQALLAGHGKDVVGFASAVADGGGVWQLGVLIRDDWQRHGIGRRLVAALVQAVRARGGVVLLADVEAERRSLLTALAAAGSLRVIRHGDGLRGELHLAD